MAVDLVGTEWRLDGIVDGSGPEASVGSVPEGVRSTLLLRDDTADSRPGCNDAGAKVAIAESTITFGESPQPGWPAPVL